VRVSGVQDPKRQLYADKDQLCYRRHTPPSFGTLTSRTCHPTRSRRLSLSRLRTPDTSCLLCRPERCPVFIFPSSELRLDLALRPSLELCLHELFTRTVPSDTTLPAASCLTSSSSSRRPMGGSTSSRGAYSSTTSLSSQSLAKPSHP
jgi:hypothetical protein